MFRQIMNSNVTQLLGSWPRWLMVAGLLVTVSGAAAGIVLSGQVTGQIPVTVSQALLVETVQVVGGDVSQGFRSDDGTSFSAAVELNTGDKFEVQLALVNASDEALVGEIILDFPPGVSLKASSADGVSRIVRTGLGTWLFDLAANHSNTLEDMTITIALADDISPGFLEITGNLRQVDLQAPTTP